MHSKNSNFININNQQAGFSLIELLVAMLISLTLIFACTALYSSLKSSIQTAQKLATAQESLRGAFYLMSRSARQAQEIHITSGSQLTTTYGSGAAGIEIYNCFGNSVSESTDTYSVLVDPVDPDDPIKNLYCGDGLVSELIALGVQEVTFTEISHANGTSGSTDVDGLKVTMKIEGMPESMIKAGGMTFTLALRQKILLDLAD